MTIHSLARISYREFTFFIFATLCLPLISIPSYALDDSGSIAEVRRRLEFGEFAKAIDIASALTESESDQAYRLIASAQFQSGGFQSALDSANSIKQNRLRHQVLGQIAGFGPNNGQGNFAGGPNNFFNPNQNNANNPGNTNSGFLGGVTQADFQPLINLIQSSIAPDTWNDVNGDGTILAYPAGVFVDPTGTLKKLKIDSNRSLKKLFVRSRSDRDANWDFESSLRKISLNRLEKLAELEFARHGRLSDEMNYLAGIYEIKFLAYDPKTNDVVIAGPAGPCRWDIDGHAINRRTGKPVLMLDDLIVCLRNAQDNPRGNHGKFGCSITPRKNNLVKTKSFLANSSLKGKAWRDQLRRVLGRQDIEVFGVDPATHAGMVLVEADYRMKLVAMGLEPSIPEIPSYLDRLDFQSRAVSQPMDVVRWWFTMNYDEIRTNSTQTIFELNGTGVKVLSENEWIDQQGERVHTGRSDGPTTGFARDFTRHFDKIAQQYPVYRRLKNLFDLAIVSTLIRTQRIDRRADWSLTFFGNDSVLGHSYTPTTMRVPTQVDSVMNYREIRERKARSTLKHTLVGVSGGIIFDAMSVVHSQQSFLKTQSNEVLEAMEMGVGDSTEHWWWD